MGKNIIDYFNQNGKLAIVRFNKLTPVGIYKLNVRVSLTFISALNFTPFSILLTLDILQSP